MYQKFKKKQVFQVNKRKLWRQICPGLNIQQSNSSSGQLKKLFSRVLEDYVKHFDNGEELPPPEPESSRRYRKPKPPKGETPSTPNGEGNSLIK